MNNMSNAIIPEPLGPPDRRMDAPMQSLIAQILSKNRDAAATQFMVIGAVPGVGTSFIASQLAAELAAMGTSTLLVEVSDKPSAATPPTPQTAGTRRDGLMQQAMRVRLALATGLAMLEAGGTTPEAAQWQQWKSRYSVIIWDVPVPTVNPLAMLMAAQVPDYMLVVQAEQTRKQIAQHVIDQMQRSGGSLLGAVLNRYIKHLPEWAYRLF